ncbi:MAG TPA: homocysteine S-methyltransferase family protein [Alphaproteobacteria bacterium]|nr:homocysteine S-methyltransferase family protein [Alphaproteobacteria bacterium]
MPTYRHDLPQLKGGIFLTDGGMETTLVFHRGLDLPHFAAFPLLETAEGRDELIRYYESYLAIASRHRLGFILDAPTWRANPDWGARLGYELSDLRRVNRAAIAFLEIIRARWQSPSSPLLLNGVVGPRGDGYKDGGLEAQAAQDYHAFQVETFAAGEADMISAMTMNNIGEAIGIARAAHACGMPCVISFTVETDGNLPDGSSLRAAIESVDDATAGAPAYYMVNCAHPGHFGPALEHDAAWAKRIRGVRANASTKSHAELDEATTLDIGDPQDLGRRYRALRQAFPSVQVLGGCCGTDHRHLAAICEACLQAA